MLGLHDKCNVEHKSTVYTIVSRPTMRMVPCLRKIAVLPSKIALPDSARASGSTQQNKDRINAIADIKQMGLWHA